MALDRSVSQHLMLELSLWKHEVEELTLRFKFPHSDLLIALDGLQTEKDVVEFLEMRGERKDQAGALLVKLRRTTETRARLRLFLPHARWAAKHNMIFSNLARVTTAEWRVATDANPFVMVPHLIEAEQPHPFFVAADMWISERKKMPERLERAARYACALTALLRKPELVQVPVQDAALIAERSKLEWKMDFAEPFDLTFGVVPSLGLGGKDMDDGVWLRAASAMTVAREFEKRGREYQEWIREERMRLSHRVRVSRDGQYLALADNLEARDRLRTLVRGMMHYESEENDEDAQEKVLVVEDGTDDD